MTNHNPLDKALKWFGSDDMKLPIISKQEKDQYDEAVLEAARAYRDNAWKIERFEQMQRDEKRGWKLIPTIGCYVCADHPITVSNPTKAFRVEAVKVEFGKAYARGENTMWFSVDMLTPASHEDALAAEQAIRAAGPSRYLKQEGEKDE